jgi:TolB-like protein
LLAQSPVQPDPGAQPAPIAITEAAPIAVTEAAPAPLGDATHPAIAVLPLKGNAVPAYGDSRDTVYQKVTQSFYKTKRFTMVERAQMAALMGEARMQNTDAIDDNSAVTMGKQLGVKFVVLGSFTGTMAHTHDQVKDLITKQLVWVDQFPAAISVNLRMVDVQTGKIAEIIESQGTAKDGDQSHSLSTVMADLSKKLDREVGNRFPQTGYVIKVLTSDRAVIDLGKNDGVNEKDEFLVFMRGEDIVHPVTGKIIKGEKTLVTEFRVVSVAEDSAIVKVTGANVPLKPGMALESKPKKRGFFEALNDTILK